MKTRCSNITYWIILIIHVLWLQIPPKMIWCFSMLGWVMLILEECIKCVRMDWSLSSKHPSDNFKTCMLKKVTRKPFPRVDRKSEVLALIHSDLCDFHSTPSLGHKNMLSPLLMTCPCFVMCIFCIQKIKHLKRLKLTKPKWNFNLEVWLNVSGLTNVENIWILNTLNQFVSYIKSLLLTLLNKIELLKGIMEFSRKWWTLCHHTLE